jgi:carbon monoxide dehydrogenase subunit G
LVEAALQGKYIFKGIGMHRGYIVFSFIMIFVFFNSSVSGAAILDPKVKKELDEGKIVISIDQNPVTKAFAPTGQAVIDASVKDVWNIITDFNSFGEFMPKTIYYKPAGWKDGKLFVDCRVKVALMTMDYQLSYIIDEEKHTTYWFYVKGPISDSQGYFRVEPYDKGRSLVTYTTTIEVGKAIPAFIEKTLGKSTFPKIFESLRKRVSVLKLKGTIPKPAITTRIYSEKAVTNAQ